ncbi:hypothetical protein BDW59DRAFT_153857 [Aspergillus cavernicola]|uniref:DUF2293 domain-containing protein n=1 Tax=Aspergillus cavernicola TaxID=176166 RepID=A0ABR4HIY1_9EURO
MTRVSRRSASVLARRSPSWIAKRKARQHKVILESVTREKKRLRSVISFEAKAPPGYTFISAGDPHFTTACKELCRKDGSKVYAVSTTPHLNTHGLSQHVHRIGYHFPSAVVATVCMDRGLYLTAAGKAVSFYDTGNDIGRMQTNSASQITINTEARDVLKDLFPNLPDNDLNQIIKTAFQKGQRKVGTAVELPLARRAQLAVVAHIRHIYTRYDRLLKTTSFHEARATVEQPTLAKLVEWRGDDENGKPVLEDVFREVIVISDDEDSDTEGEQLLSHGRDTSVEVISSNPVVEELQMKPFYHGNTALRDAQVETSGDEAPPGFRFVREVPQKAKIDRRGFSRYQAWDRAINRYRNVTSGSTHQPPSYSAGEPLQEILGFDREAPSRRPVDPRHSSVAPYSLPNQRAVNSNFSRPPLNPVAEHRPLEIYPLAEPPNKRRDALAPLNPRPLERTPVSEPVRHSFQQSDLTNAPVFVSGPREIHERNGESLRPPPRPPGHLQHSRNVNQQDRVLPSVESPLPLEIKRPNSGHIEHLTKRMSGAFTFRSVTPHRQNNQEYLNHTFPQEPIQAHVSKRRCVAYYEPVPMENPLPATASTASSAYPVDRYATAGQSSVPNGPHVRRRYVAPVEPPRISERQTGNAQDPSVTTRFDREPQVLANQGPIKDHDGQPFSPGHLVNSQATHHRSPGQARITSTTRYGIPVGKGRERIVQPRPSDTTGTRIPHSLHGHAPVEMKTTEVTVPQFEPSRWSRNPERPPVSYKPAEKQRLYADGFVRPVDIREPGKLEYRSAPRLPPSHIMESPPQAVNAKFHSEQHRRVPSDNLILMPPRGQRHLDSQVKAPQQYPVAGGDQDSRHHDPRLLRTPSPVHQHGRQSKNTLAPSRYGHKDNPILIGT